MAAKPIDNLSIVVSANTRPLATDLQQAVRELDRFGKAVARSRPDPKDVLPGLPRGQTVAELEKTFRRAKEAQKEFRRTSSRQDVSGLGFVYNRKEEMVAARRDLTQYGKPGVVARALRWLSTPVRRVWADDATARGQATDAAKAAAGTGRAGSNPVAAKARDTERSFLGLARAGVAVGVGMVAAEAGLSGVAGAFQQVKQSVQLAGELEQTTLAFEVMLRSAERAKTLMTDMRKFAASTPFGLGEVTASTRMLTAYGVAADQLMPTMRMLGDVSAAFGKELPLRDLTYLYGTLFAQQRAYAIDVRQFAGRGIPIYEELAKVLGKSNAEVKQLIEDGRVSSREVTQAFVNMTSAGGRFYGMTERQGKTFLGQWEQMQDAFKLAQTKFGQVLIEELGLAEATRDLDAFAKRLEHGLDSIRPAVRFVGELGRGAVQLTYELGRAAAMWVDANAGFLDRGFPGIRQAWESFRAMIKDAQNFKFDDEKLINFAADSASMIVRVFTGVVDSITAVVDAGMRKLEPLVRLLTWLDQKVNGDALAGRRPGDALNVDAIRPPVPGMDPGRQREEFAALDRDVRDKIEYLELLRSRGADPRLAAYQAASERLRVSGLRRQAFLEGYEGDPNTVLTRLRAGDVPQIRGAPPPPPPPGPPEPPLRDRWLAGIEATRADLLGASRQRKAEAEQQRLAAEAKKTADALAVLRRAIMPMPIGAGWHDLAAGMGREQSVRWAEMGALGAAFGVADGGRARLAADRGGHGVRLPDVFPHLDELARELRKEFDPRPELEMYRADLMGVRDRQLLGADTNAITARAWERKVGEVAQRLGLGGPARLADAVHVGTAEDARLLNAWATMGGQQTTEQLLQQLLAVAQQQLTVQGKTLELAKIPEPALRPPP